MESSLLFNVVRQRRRQLVATGECSAEQRRLAYSEHTNTCADEVLSTMKLVVPSSSRLLRSASPLSPRPK